MPRAERLSFSLRTMLAVAAIVAVGAIALRSGSWRWERIWFTITLAIHLAAVLGVIYRRGRRQAFWVGFALFGWASMAIVHLSALRLMEHQLVAHELRAWLQDVAPPGESSGLALEVGGGRIAIYSFPQIVHCWMSLTMGTLGGILGAWFCATSGRDVGRGRRGNDGPGRE